jgi:hypothetical protein
MEGCASPRNTLRNGSRIQFRLATQRDDEDIRRLLRESPTEGRVALALTREPNYFLDTAQWTPEKKTVLAWDGNTLACMGSCTVTMRRLNGIEEPVGYLGALRLASGYEGRFDILRRGYRFYKEMEWTHPPNLQFTSIASDNIRAQRFLERSLPGMPKYRCIAEFVSLVLPTVSKKSSAPGCTLSALESQDDLSDVMAIWDSRQSHLSPTWRLESLKNLKPLGLDWSNFKVVRENERVVAIMALWDQRPFKQVVVHHYSPLLAALRPSCNQWAKLLGKPGLPVPGSELSLAYLSYAAACDLQPQMLLELISGMVKVAHDRGIEYVCLGFDVRDSVWRKVKQQFHAREYKSRIYSVHWDSSSRQDLDPKCFVNPDLATL